MTAVATRPNAIRARRPRAFTLVEVMIVVLILAILATVAAPSLLNAATPLPSTISDTLEIDMRRARIEAIGRMKPVVLMLGKGRERWWLADAEASALPIDGTLRVFGNGTLGNYGGYMVSAEVNGSPLANGDAVIARFDAVGSRDDTTIVLSLIGPLSPKPLATWTLEPQRTKFTGDGG